MYVDTYFQSMLIPVFLDIPNFDCKSFAFDKINEKKKTYWPTFGVDKNIPFSKSTKSSNACIAKSFICSVLVMVLC